MTSFADITSPEQMASVLSEHNQLAYVVLFLGAFFETLIPFSLAVLGEVFFLSGALLAGMGALDLWAVIAVLYAGGILGDNASYWLGRYYGVSLFERLARWPGVGRFIHSDNYQRGVDFFQRRGAIAVFIARLSGPLSWVMPAMAGIFRLNYPTFLRFNTLGVMIGIGQFILVGYFFGGQLESILAWLQQVNLSVVISIVTLILLGLFCWRYYIARLKGSS
jgi:membrane-associated protein